MLKREPQYFCYSSTPLANQLGEMVGSERIYAAASALGCQPEPVQSIQAVTIAGFAVYTR